MDHRVGGLGRKEAASGAMLAPVAAFAMVLGVRAKSAGACLLRMSRAMLKDALCRPLSVWAAPLCAAREPLRRTERGSKQAAGMADGQTKRPGYLSVPDRYALGTPRHMLRRGRGNEHKRKEEHKEDSVCSLDACKRVIDTVAEDGHCQGEKAIPEARDMPLLYLCKLRPAIERAHEDSEDAVARNGSEGTDDSGTWSEREDIADILCHSEAKAAEDGIDDSVKDIVEVPVMPGGKTQEHIFRAFLCHGDDTEVHEKEGMEVLGHATSKQGIRSCCLDQDGGKGGEYAEEEELCEKGQRLLVDRIHLPDICHKEGSRKHCHHQKDPHICHPTVFHINSWT